jgi:hypothetical protein
MNRAIFKNTLIVKLMLILIVGLTLILPWRMLLADSKRQVKNTAIRVKLATKHEIVVLIHGLIRTTLSMRPLKSYLEKQGYQVYSYSYSSTRFTIKQHGIYLNEFVRSLLANNPGVKIDFITHSLGGIIAREALSNWTPEQLKNIGCLIMLAPPNQGSKLAKFSTTFLPMFTLPIKPLAELSSDKSSYVHRIPVPPIKIGIIAGRYDVKVPPELARLEGQTEFVIVNASHTFIMNNGQTKKLISSFLEKKSFGKRLNH